MLRSFTRLGRKFRAINARYAVPRIRVTRAARAALLVLRAYLFLLVVLLLYKFVSILIA